MTYDIKRHLVRIDPTPSESPRFVLLAASELASIPPMRWLVRGVFPESGLAAIYGPPASGKSFLVLDLLGAIAGGREWFSHPVAAAPSIYVALEGEAGVAQRIAAHTARNGTPPDALRVILTPLDIRRPDDRRELVEAIKGAGMAGGVLCIDTLNRAAPGADENDSREMGELISAMRALQGELGGLVLAVHHTGKDQARGLRGHSSLLAALDAVVEVSRTEDRREWRVVKSKDGEDGRAHPFRLDVVELGEDAEGYPITSCVVAPEDAPADSVSRAKVPRGGNQRIVWDGLGELMRGSPDFGKAGAPPSRPCVRLDDAIHSLRGRLPCPTDRQTERTRQAITGLIASGLIQHREGWLWAA